MIRLKELRLEKGMNMRQTAIALNIPYTTYISYEKAEREPNSETLIMLADYFNCSIDYLIGRTDERIDDNLLDRALEVDNDLLEKYGNIYEAKKAQEIRDNSLTVEQLFNQTVSRKEIEHITKYRTLDGYGKRAVESVLDVEYERCSLEQEDKSNVIELPFAMLKASAGLGDYLFDENFEMIEVEDSETARKASFVIQIDGDSMLPRFKNGDKVFVKGQQEIELGEIGIFIVDGQGFIKQMGEKELISINPEFPNIPINEYNEFKCVGKVIGIV